MITQISFTGGARIGMANATWPFASLKVTKDRLDLNATIIGNLVFRPEDIISIEPYSEMMSSGLKINHRVPTYKDKVIFWTFKNPNEIIRQIQQIGFLDNTSTDSNGMPLGNGVISALGLVFLTCLLMLTSKGFRSFVLKEGRELQDISKFLYFAMFVCGFMMFAFLMVINF